MTYSERLAKQAASKILKPVITDDDISSSSNITSKDLRTLKRGYNKYQRAKARERKKIHKHNATLITRALDNVNRMIDKTRRAQSSGMEVYTPVSLKDTQKWILEQYDYYLVDHPGKKIKSSIEGRLKDLKKKTHFDNLVFYTIEIDEIKDGKMEIVAIKTYSEGQLKKMRTTQARNPKSTSSVDDRALGMWLNITDDNDFKKEFEEDDEIVIEGIDNDEKVEKFKSKFNVSRDVSIGGSSQLINALGYTYGCDPAGTMFVKALQSLMNNPTVWAKLELAYRGNKYDLQDLINDAVKKDWYNNFVTFRDIITDLIAYMEELDMDFSELENMLYYHRKKDGKFETSSFYNVDLEEDA